MPRISLPEAAHQIITEHLQPGDPVIDATCGNGYDTLFLAQQVGNNGRVYGFDIQSQAIESTSKRLQDAHKLDTVTLFHVSHAQMLEHIPAEHHGYIKAVMFNLGYLPGSDKSVITRSDSTLSALNAAILLLTIKSLLTVLVYPGHTGGDDEAKEVKLWLKQLDQNHYKVTTVNSQVNKANAPRLHVIYKK